MPQNILTAEEFFNEHGNGLAMAYSVRNKEGHYTPVVSHEAVIKFANYHVQKALEAAAEVKPTTIPGAKYKGPLRMILKEDVFNCYPLENIK